MDGQHAQRTDGAGGVHQSAARTHHPVQGNPSDGGRKGRTYLTADMSRRRWYEANSSSIFRECGCDRRGRWPGQALHYIESRVCTYVTMHQGRCRARQAGRHRTTGT